MNDDEGGTTQDRTPDIARARLPDGPSGPRYDVMALLGGSPELGLVLDETEYRLRRTSRGKLILYK